LEGDFVDKDNDPCRISLFQTLLSYQLEIHSENIAIIASTDPPLTPRITDSASLLKLIDFV
jgi:hypothetical protein